MSVAPYTNDEAEWLGKSKSGKKPNWFKRAWRAHVARRQAHSRRVVIDHILRTAQPSMRKELMAIMSRDESLR